MLSVVVPVYNENNIELCAERIMSVLEKANILYEIVFVDDGSENGVWNEINNLTIKNKNIRAVALSRNFGKENAICAGIDVSAGDCVVCIDADMQHPPEMIPQMYEMWQNGYEVVEGVKRCRCEGHKIYDIFARTFYYILKKLAHIEAMFTSMTPAERTKPDIINSSRKRRIALGSGTSIAELNAFLKQFEQMKKLMKQFSNPKKMKRSMGGFGGLFGRR